MKNPNNPVAALQRPPGVLHTFRLLSQDEAHGGQNGNVERRQETGNKGGLRHDHYYILPYVGFGPTFNQQ